VDDAERIREVMHAAGEPIVEGAEYTLVPADAEEDEDQVLEFPPEGRPFRVISAAGVVVQEDTIGLEALGEPLSRWIAARLTARRNDTNQN
jgi:hypothetical protein